MNAFYVYSVGSESHPKDYQDYGGDNGQPRHIFAYGRVRNLARANGGYLVSFYSVNGFTEAQNQGWDPEFNFGSAEAAKARWTAALKLHADFVATDQYELLGGVIRSAR